MTVCVSVCSVCMYSAVTRVSIRPCCQQYVDRISFVFQSTTDPIPNYEITLSPAAPFEVDALGFIQLSQATLDFERNTTYVFDVRIFFFFSFYTSLSQFRVSFPVREQNNQYVDDT